MPRRWNRAAEAVDFLYQVGVRTPGGGVRNVATFNALVAIDGATDKPVKQAGGDLMTLHGKRNRADCDWQDLSMEGQDQAQDLVKGARGIVSALDECLADDARVDDVHAYFRMWIPLHGHRLGLTLV
ncbi:MAG: hypothetical protein ACRC33_25840 [Gemmataceae bacterium]